MLTNKLTGVGAAGDSKTYIEDVFSTYLYTGNGTTRTINNGIDLAGKDGLVWIKGRTQAYYHYLLADSNGRTLSSNTTDAIDGTYPITKQSNGFSIGSGSPVNASGETFVSWTFRKAPKFFDVVTYTGDGSSNRKISHNLGSVPGMIIVKNISSSGISWVVYHRSLGTTQYLVLNSSDAAGSADVFPTTPTTTDFYVQYYGNTNASGSTYVAYLFAHDTSTDGLIQCGSFTSPSSSNSITGNITINLGWEPQYLLVKNATGTSSTAWYVYDNMRGVTAASTTYPTSKHLQPNNTNTESNSGNYSFNSTGFTNHGGYNSGDKIIYMAIRRGPMRTPTDATKVFSSNTRSGTGANATFTGAGFPIDVVFAGDRNLGNSFAFFSRLLGTNKCLFPFATAAESSPPNSLTGWDSMAGFSVGSDTNAAINYSGSNLVYESFRRAPGFFDVVCYTGNGSASQSINHSLGVTPNLIIIKPRNTAVGWTVFWGTTSPLSGYMVLNTSAADSSADTLTSTSTAFTATLGDGLGINANSTNYVAYLFASCPGVSKVGSYTGNGSSQTINCGFTNGARFVLIKRTDSTGDWYVWDTARGIVTANDPHLSLNTTAAEVTTDDTIDPDSTGFIVNQVTATNVNVSGGSYIYLAIA